MNLIELFANDYTLRLVSLGSALLGIVSGVVGSFAVLKKQGLLGDAVSHAALPGIAIMFLLIQTKNTEMFVLGALISGLIATGLILSIEKYTRIKMDSAMALVLSVFFGFGLVLLTYIQKIPNANQAGLDKFIFGQASSMLRRDVVFIAIVGIILLILVGLFWKEFKLVSFDAEFADSLGISSKYVSIILSSMIVVSIIIGLQTVGVILMSALLVAPGVAARQWTNRLSVMVALAGFFGFVSGVLGTLMSSTISKMPTGPSIVLIVSIIVIISMSMAPNRGLVWKVIRDHRNYKNISEDKILMDLFDLALNHQDPFYPHPIASLHPNKISVRKPKTSLKEALLSLQDKGYISKTTDEKWAITQKGLDYLSMHPMKKEGYDVSTN